MGIFLFLATPLPTTCWGRQDIIVAPFDRLTTGRDVQWYAGGVQVKIGSEPQAATVWKMGGYLSD